MSQDAPSNAHQEKPPLLQLLNSVLELSSLILKAAQTQAKERASNPSPAVQGKTGPTPSRPTLQRSESFNEIANADTTFADKLAKSGTFEQDLNRLMLWKRDVTEAGLEPTLVKRTDNPMYEPVRRILFRISDVVLTVLPQQYLRARQIRQILDQVRKIREGLGMNDDGSKGRSELDPCKVMVTTDKHEIKEAQGLPELLKAFRKHVSDLLGLWDFMELAQESLRR